MAGEPTVFVVDDDELMRSSVCALARSMEIRAEAFCSAEGFLENHVDGRPGCLVTDIRMLGMSGLELQDKLRELDVHLPVIVMTAYANTPLTVRAMQNGALTLLEKPFEDNELWDAIRKALARDAAQHAAHERRRELSRRIERLTPTQREVMDLIVAGKSNKWIANELDVGIRTVESRRREVFDRMQADSLAELVRLAIEANSESSPTAGKPSRVTVMRSAQLRPMLASSE